MLLHQQQAHYLLCVKAHQPTLFAWLVAASEAPEPRPCDVAQRQERSHGRWVHRRVSVYEHLGDWPTQWPGLRRWLCVERWGYRDDQPFAQTHYYISDLALSAEAFLEGVQGHWSIENRLHWPKDVVLGEDRAPQRSGQGPANYSTIRNFFISAARRVGIDSVAAAKRHFANRLDKVLLSLQ
ncbi:MAG: ISAs1 family transposase [Leptolyngbya sp. SIOISBB]|nr:ISAs1 family transposase [Leptolyngbya sp. SIOISBB]NEQ47172.1 ISAs1 family transposase [Leptolyngbya sp. SIOISBB]